MATTVYVETFTKQSGETLDYQIDWSNWLETGDTVASSAWSVPTGITQVGDATSDTTSATILLSGGTAGAHYEVANTIETSAGQIAIRTLDIKVVNP